MEPNLNILVLDDSPEDVARIKQVLSKEEVPFNCCLADPGPEMGKTLEEFLPDVVLFEHGLSNGKPREVLHKLQQYRKKVNPVAVFLLVTGTLPEEEAIQVVREGADDYLLKDRLLRLPAAIQAALCRNRLAEQHRKAEEERLQLLEILQKSLNEIFIFGSDTLRFRYANEEALRNLGYTLEEITEISPMDLLELGDAEKFRRIVESVGKSLKARVFESYLLRKDKTSFPAQVHLQLIEEHAGKKTYIANVLDITEIKNLEQQKDLALFIQVTFNRYPELKPCLYLILEGLCKRKQLDAGEIFTFNFEKSSLLRAAFYEAEGEDIGPVGKNIAEIVLQKEQPVFFEDLQQALGIKDPEALRFSSAKAFPLGLGDEILAVVVFYSKKKRRSKEAFPFLGEGIKNQLANNLERKRTEEELHNIFLHSPVVLAIASTDGFFKRVNPFFSDLLGISEEEILRTPYVDFLHPDDIKTVREWEANMHLEHVTHYQNRFRTSKGNYIWLAWSVTPFHEDTLSFVVGMNITKEKKNLEAIELQNKKLAEIAWEQSHVVRAPLARMMGCIHLLEQSDEHLLELLESVKSSAHELDRIIKTIVAKTDELKNV